MAGEILGIGNSDSNLQHLNKIEDQIKQRKKEKALEKETDKNAYETLNKIESIIGKNNKEATQLLEILVGQNRVDSRTAEDLAKKITESIINQDEYLSMQKRWLEDEAQRKKDDEKYKKDKSQELSLWNVMRAGISSLIPGNPEKAKKGQETFNAGMAALGNKFFDMLKKNYGKFLMAGITAFGMMSLWGFLIIALLALFDPNGVFIDAIISGIQALVPILMNIITMVVQKLPEIIGRMINIVTKIVQELIPVIMKIIPLLLNMLVTYVPIILTELGKGLDQILSIIFGEQISIFEPLMKVVGEIFVYIVDLLKIIAPVLIQLIKELLPPIMNLIGALLPLISDLLKILMPVLIFLIQKVLIPIIGWVVSLLKPAIAFVGEFAKFIHGLISLDKDMIINALKGMGNAILTLLLTYFKGVKKLYFDLPKEILKMIFGSNSPIRKFFDGLLEYFGKFFIDMFDWFANTPIGKAITGFFSWVGEKFDKIKEFLKKIDLFNSIGEFFIMLKTGFMNIIYSLGGLFKTIGWMITHPLQAKNAGWGGIGQRIGLESIALETGINFDEVAKNEAGKELTIREIQNFSNTINNQEVQRIFSEKIL